MTRMFLMCLLLFVVGCTKSAGPPSVDETSASRSELVDRVKFIETYVKFRRRYVELEYDVFYQNGGGLGPSEFDVRLVAIVPPGEIDDWAIAGKLDDEMTGPDWVATTAKAIDVSSISEWYADGNRIVGIDREQNIVAYRVSTR